MSLTIPLLASSHVHPQLVGPAQSAKFRIAAIGLISIAFSSEVDAASREENASKQESRASVLIESEPKL
jgi:hypothetical protein